jgi:hypothetical protein
VFRLAGRVVGVELQRDEEGKSRGMACVVYDHPVEAVQAISMLNNRQLFDRKMSVRFDKVKPGPPRRSDRLPEGLQNCGMGLGKGGAPLLDVRANLPSAETAVVTAALQALQAALATIMGIGGMGGYGGNGGGNMGVPMGGGMGGSGGGMGRCWTPPGSTILSVSTPTMPGNC